MPYLSDPTLVPRVRKYLEANLNKPSININVMADELQRHYREYANRKRSAFRASVNKAVSIVLDRASPDTSSSSSTSVSPVLLSNLQQPLSPPALEQSIPKTAVYQDKSVYNRNTMEESELIDISSDDSQGEPPSISPVAELKNTRDQQQLRIGIQDPRCSAIPVFKALPALLPDFERNRKRKMDYYATLSSIAKPFIKKKKLAVSTPQLNFQSIGGMDKTLEEICNILLHITHPEIYNTLGVSPPGGFLLHGPPGVGKTLLVSAIAGELQFPLLKVSAPELVDGVSGGSEKLIRKLFDDAIEQAPCILFIDEIDAIAPNRMNSQKDMEKRIVAQIITCLDGLNTREYNSRVVVIGATNRPDTIDPALRRAGRFDREISIGIPNKETRRAVIEVLVKGFKLEENFDYDMLASLTPGFVGADLLSLIREAVTIAVKRLLNSIRKDQQIKSSKTKATQNSIKAGENVDTPAIIVDEDSIKETESVNGSADSEILIIEDDTKAGKSKKNEEIPQSSNNVEADKNSLQQILGWLVDKTPVPEEILRGLDIKMEDFKAALKTVQPSSKREGFVTVPNTTWDDVGSLQEIRKQLQLAIVAPVRHAKQFESAGISISSGVLLCGPPGCGKTLLAKAVAHEAGINFISVKGPELLNMYVGESERAVRVVFERARNSSPCVIFFDELDALCPKRSGSGETSPTMRVVNQLLTEMDGIGTREGVFVLAASNRPDIIDPAMLRPGRLDQILYVGLPDSNDRIDILRAITKNGTSPQLAPDVNLELIAKCEDCSGFTGADLAALVKQASLLAMEQYFENKNVDDAVVVSQEHFQKAICKIRPSVSKKDREHYEKIRETFSAVPKNSDVEDMELS